MSSINQNEKFTLDIQKKRNKQFFERVRRTGAYYNAKSWEEDYKRQLHGQKFMRQVAYERPKDWVDPFQEVPEEVKPKRGANREPSCRTPSRRSGASASGSHVSRMKSLRAGEGARGDKNGEPPEMGQCADSQSLSGSVGGSVDLENSQEPVDKENVSLSSRLLASLERAIRITSLPLEEGGGHEGPPPPLKPTTTTTDERLASDAAMTRESFTATANSLPSLFSHSMESFSTIKQEFVPEEVSVSIFCSLVDNRVLFITVDSVDEENPIHAEAQIDCNELMIVDIGDEDGQEEPPAFPSDPETQEILAFDLINEITLCVQPGSQDYEIVLSGPNRSVEGTPERCVGDEVTVEQAKQILEGVARHLRCCVLMCCPVAVTGEIYVLCVCVSVCCVCVGR